MARFVFCSGVGGVLAPVTGQFGSGRQAGHGSDFIAARGAESGMDSVSRPRVAIGTDF